jgi:hypothetical protein
MAAVIFSIASFGTTFRTFVFAPTLPASSTAAIWKPRLSVSFSAPRRAVRAELSTVLRSTPFAYTR